MQTSYPSSISRGFPGMLAESTVLRQSLSFVNAEAAAEIPFGVGVVRGTADNRAVLPAAAGDNLKFLGVVQHAHVYAKPEQLGDTGVKPKQPITVLSRGRILVQVEEAVVAGDRGFMRIAAGAGGTQKGAWRKSADTATAIEILGAVYRTSVAAGELAVLEVDATAARAAI